MKKSISGFTIVELLIVIVVIAILAAISIVAFTGVQNRAQDSSVQSDLSALAKQYELFAIDEPSGTYPDTTADLAALEVSINKNAYMIDPDAPYNIVTCHAENASKFAISAISKSGKRFYITNGGVTQEYTGTANWFTGNTYVPMCTSILTGSTFVSGGAGYGLGSWRSWTNG